MQGDLPSYARIDRSLPAGECRLLDLLPDVARSPALARVEPDPSACARLLDGARVVIRPRAGYAFVDDDVPCIVLSEGYYRTGPALDLYLDLLHELTHLRQLRDGRDIWDESLPYVDRPTEIEGYAVAVGEGRRLGMDEEEIVHHLRNPWMSEADVARLGTNVDGFLGGGGEARRPG